MRKIIIFAFCFLLYNFLNALGTLRVESIKMLPETSMNIEVRDADGKYAPVLIVKTELKGLGFQNVSRPTIHAAEYMTGDHHYKFYMNDNQRVIKITHSDYEPLEVRLLADFGINVKVQRVYELVLTNVPEKEFIIVNIVSDPSDAEKLIDGKNMGTGQSFELFIGSHILKLQKSGFKSLSKDIEVSKSNTLFNNLNLQEIEPVMITIKSIPTGADIFLDDVEIGKTNFQPFKFPGTYKLRLSLSKFETIEETITVTETSNNTFSYNLEKRTVILKINTTPSNAEVYINNEKLSGNTKEVSPGRYKLEVKKDGYFDDFRTVDVQKGKDVTESFTLKQKTGKLQVTVEPMEAKATLKKDGKTIDNWKGSKMKTNLQVGEYEISCQANGFKTKIEKVVIELDKTNIINLVMEEGSDVLVNMVFVQGCTFKMGDTHWDGIGRGDEKPVHSVVVSDIYIGKYEVTQKEWKEIMGSNPASGSGVGDDYPVYYVNWYDVVEFCNKKSVREGLTPCYSINKDRKDPNNESEYDNLKWEVSCNFSTNGYRLPTEAEWEYAARGGVKTQNSASYKYSGSNNINDVAWYSYNSGDKTHSVGTMQANKLGIYDMSGNVKEWIWDWYNFDYYRNSTENKPRGAERGSLRVLRGGSCISSDDQNRLASRNSNFPYDNSFTVGFRIVRTVE